MGLFVLSMTMFDLHDEASIYRLAATSVPSLGPFQVVAGYRLVGDRLVPIEPPVGTWPPDEDLAAQLTALVGADGLLAVPGTDRGWTRALALRGSNGHRGYLVIETAAEPIAEDVELLGILAQQTGAALSAAALHHRQVEHVSDLRGLNSQLADSNRRLASTLDDLRRQSEVAYQLTRTAVRGEGESGIAQAVFDMTGFPVAIEDRFGNLRVWAGPGRPGQYRASSARSRAELLGRAQREAHPVREAGRLIALAQPRDVVLGLIALIDPDNSALALDVFTLEQAATVLAMELSHLRSLAEVELRLRRGLVEDLLHGTDGQSAYGRADALGHDLRRPHRVVAMTQCR